jgi:hypothetical protein
LAARPMENSQATARTRAWLMGLAGWAVPGLGHLLQKKWARAALVGGVVWLKFFLGFYLGGHLFKVSGGDQGLGVVVQ